MPPSTHQNGRKAGPNAKAQDPIIDYLMHKFHGSDFNYSSLAWNAGLSETTIRNWDSGATRSPQYRSVIRMMRAMRLGSGEIDEASKRSLKFYETEIRTWQKTHEDRKPDAKPKERAQ